MSEVTFAKSFLATLDKKPIKLPADHVSDPRKYPSQSPYTLPRQTHPFPRKGLRADAPTTNTKKLTATVKPMRGGEAVTISDLTLESTIHEVKTQYAQESGHSQDKIKILYNKKPAADLKTLKDLGVSGEKVELSAMVMGAGTTPTPGSPAVSSPVTEKPQPVMPAVGGDPMDVDKDGPAPDSEKAQAEAGTKHEGQTSSVAEVLGGEEFWQDLKGFLGQRLRDEGEGEKLVKAFREAYGKR